MARSQELLAIPGHLCAFHSHTFAWRPIQRRKNYQAAGHFLVLGLGCALVRVWCCGRYLAHHVTACGAQFRGPATMSTVDWRNKAIEIARKATDLDKEAEKMEDPDKQVSVRRGCIGLL